MIQARLEDLEAVGFEKLVYEDFYEVLRDLILNIVEPDRNGHTLTSDTLLERFQDPESTSPSRADIPGPHLTPHCVHSEQLDRRLPPTLDIFVHPPQRGRLYAVPI